jgi:hypothetical protein
MMGDKFQLGPFKDVIVGASQRVTQGSHFLEKFFGALFACTSTRGAPEPARRICNTGCAPRERWRRECPGGAPGAKGCDERSI